MELGKTGEGSWDGADEVVEVLTGYAEVYELDCFLADLAVASEDCGFWCFGERFVEYQDKVVDDV